MTKLASLVARVLPVRGLLPAVAAAVLAGTIAALAAVPYTLLWSQAGDVAFYGPLGGYTVKNVPTSGFVLTFDNNQSDLLLRPAGTLAWGYVYMAPGPVDGRRACFFSTQALTAMVVYANAGQTINDAVTSMLANVRVCYTYSIGNATWDRSQ